MNIGPTEIRAAVEAAQAAHAAIDTFSVHCAESNGDCPVSAVAALNRTQWAFHDALNRALRVVKSVPVGHGNLDDATEGAAWWADDVLAALREDDCFA